MNIKIHEEYIDMFIGWNIELSPIVQYKDGGYYIVEIPTEESKPKSKYLFNNERIDE